MNNADILKWGEELTQEVYHKWLEWKKREDHYPFSESGFSVFYSRPYLHPGLLIIGFNPGGDEKAFREDYDSHLPPERFNDYFQTGKDDYALAKKMRKLFEDIGKIETLKKSVKTNLIFFRSLNTGEWKKIEKKLRQEMEKFCFAKVREIIEILKPHVVLTEGIQTFTLLRSILEDTSEPEFRSGQRERAIFAKSNYKNIPLIGVLHLTGARPSNEEIVDIKKYLSNEIS